MESLYWLGFLVLVLFYGSYLCKQLLLKRQGISTNRLGLGNKPARTLRIETALKFATFTMAGMQIISLLVVKEAYLLLAQHIIRCAGIGISALGAAVFITAMAYMKTSWRAGVDSDQNTVLIKSGIYRISRNPAFLGFDLFYIGFALAFSNPLQLVFTLLCVVLFHLQILEEEQYLPLVFGNAYEEYKQVTARYFIFF
ncbi:isoprenylcysteine carboxylmethyltransferase family protein [Clostridium boliviensis]|uniref:Isoprenylcysteine carboxylmethyltransferase family protein n=1 Tax=Clostridium boliviensis TaxID=318465 RepID=A0ABU4GIQ1_9CLOT|nr:isoprenylcysteine carboxylmethyltransferase family protein [Clostridium boliviensis]MDW2797484.1 isoprenylcysteine carboxylmethyltransferase family protein [Clostridium boliviensis]